MLSPPPAPFELPVVGPPTERRDAAANRRRILEAARKVIADSGPEALSMDAVAAAAGVGKGTIFRRFGDRAGLTEALLDEHMRAFQDAFLTGPPPLGPGAGPGQRLEAFLTELVLVQHEHLAVAIAGEMSFVQAVPAVLAPLHLHIRLLVQELDDALEADVMATMLLAAVSPRTLRMCQLRGLPPESVTASVCALLRGLLAAPGGADQHRR